MPNIIEQQDLLKGLPDQRLALLMKQPSGDIPPFLVAAEAQRRQAIRQQFAGQGSQESVVDTLTKQMANVPQNIQAPMQTPPNIPPAQQAGIGALQQGMAGGGPVRRMAGGGAALAAQGAEAATPWDFGFIPRVVDYVGSGFDTFSENARKFGVNPTEQQRRELAEKSASEAETPEDPYVDPFLKAGRPAERARPPVKPVNPTVGTSDSSAENKDKAESASYRSRLEELMRASEPSNWEEAQKWFAMSAAIMQPGQNLMQGLADAGMIYSQAEGQQAADARDAELELQKALLQYDIGERDYNRQVASQAQSDKLEAMKYQAGAAYKEAELYRKAADDATDALNRQIDAISKNSLDATPEMIANDPTVKALQERVKMYNDAVRTATIRAQGFNTILGGAYGLPAGFDVSDGDSIYNTGG